MSSHIYTQMCSSILVDPWCTSKFYLGQVSLISTSTWITVGHFTLSHDTGFDLHIDIQKGTWLCKEEKRKNSVKSDQESWFSFSLDSLSDTKWSIY